ncbi:PREDICTED: protein Jade-3-like [Amphimedon queenslandica]|nr:PREDICTED: protein Jade-3-like [Amphimedon queenslandica]|eukprot:XP_019856885.1 PREDICTED: protein Jade-3-like [Amphimedon queenslandica]
MEQTPLQRVESQFYEYTSHEELSKELKISSQASTLIYNYWKLKRKCNHNQPLLLGLHLDLSYQRLQLANNQIDRQVPLLTDDDDFLRIVHLRHNLEKARNLVYMIQRRERLKSICIRSDHDITRLQLKQVEEEEEEKKSKAKTLAGGVAKGVVNNRKPLCLKRLGISSSNSSSSVDPAQAPPSTTTSHCFTNGPMLVLHPIDHTMANEESLRLLRKKRPHLISSPLSSLEHVTQRRRVSESGCGHGDIVNHDNTRREKSNKSILC